MRKKTITEIWLGGMVAIAVGLVVAGVGVWLMLVNAGTFTAAPDGSGFDFVPRANAYFWNTVALIVAGGLVAVIGGIVQFVAWIAALANSWRLADKMWFLITLILGLVGFGLVVMIVYLLVAPDSYDEDAQLASPAGGVPTALPSIR